MTDPDLVNEDAWRLLRAHVAAASESDQAAFVLAGEEASRNTLKVQRLAGLYLIHLLKYRLYEVCSRRVPTVDDLAQVAQRLSPRYSMLLPNTDPTLLDETLRTSFKLSPPHAEVKGANFTVSGLAVLGLLLEDSSQLDALRPYLADWCARDHVSIDKVARGS